MASDTSFVASKTYIDRVNFPYGFARSGDFSNRQVALLEKHGAAYKALHDGTAEPQNAEEQAFVNCCRNQKPAETDHEKVWVKYLQAIAQRSAHYSPGTSPGGVLKASSSESDSDADVDGDFDYA